ncbi:hypothetical protein SFB2_211G1 [Candidatus Arthromitus sp. SFB-2]|nr:hypothetical protein SFB2_211G1 [Candidatus Arthromitus sp. SFB-2]
MRIAQIIVYPIDTSNELMPSMYDNATPAKEAWDSVSLIYEYLLRTIKISYKWTYYGYKESCNKCISYKFIFKHDILNPL